MLGAINSGLAGKDAILLGRRTYLEFADFWPGREGPMADFLNETPKYVVSSTLETLEWGPASLIGRDLAGELTELKQQPGGDIQIPGSPRLVASLLREGLLDELAIMIAPVVVGSGNAPVRGRRRRVRARARGLEGARTRRAVGDLPKCARSLTQRGRWVRP